MTKILISILLTASMFATYSCSKKDQPQPPVVENAKGTPTAKGLPAGDAITKTIGVDGGSLSSGDNNIIINVPAGAVTSTTVFSIQPIENKAPNGVGAAYRLLPEGIHFAKPVTITFKYNDQMVEGSLPELVYTAYQDKEGVWKAQRKTTLDITNKTVSITSSHFSDWAIFECFRLDVVKSTLGFNESTALVVKEVNLLGSLTNPEADLYEVTTTQKTGNWKLTGQGTLSPNGAQATYTAPPVPPTPNPVSISVEVSDVVNRNGQKGKVILFAGILVAGNYMTIKVGDANYRFTDVEATVSNGMIMVNGNGGGAGVGLSVNLSGPGSKSFDVKEFTPTVVVAAFGGISYASYYDECNPRKTVTTSGSISINAVGNAGEYVEGSFSGKLANGNGPCDDPGFISVTGSFRCKRKL